MATRDVGARHGSGSTKERGAQQWDGEHGWGAAAAGIAHKARASKALAAAKAIEACDVLACAIAGAVAGAKRAAWLCGDKLLCELRVDC